MTQLTILTCTKYAPHSGRFLQAFDELAVKLDADMVEYDGRGFRAIEDCLEDAVNECDDGSYILRLDDDELPSPEMVLWLENRLYETHDHWCFPRKHLWLDEDHYIPDFPLYPDLQTRLSIKAKSGGRHKLHDGSPFGSGEIAPCDIEHHKFLVRSTEERQLLLAEYRRINPAADMWAVFSVPECFPGFRVVEREERPIPLQTGKE